GVSFLEGDRRADQVTLLGARARGAVAEFVDLIDGLNGLAADGTGPAAMVEAAYSRSGYMDELEAERSIESMGRVENLRELYGVALEFEERNPGGTLADFLEQVALVTEQD